MCSWDVRVTYEAEILSLVGLALSFSVVYISLPRMARKLTKEGIAGRDVLKKGDVLVPESGGIMIIIAVVASVSIIAYLFVSTAYSGEANPPRETMQLWMLSAIATLMGIGFIGLVDDYLNIPQRYKVILPAIAALPVAFAFIDRTDFWIPFVGTVVIGVLYPLVIIPLGITAASNLTNMYAGLNGLEIGSGLIACAFTGLAAAIIGRWPAVIVLAPMAGALGAFLIYASHRRFPCSCLPRRRDQDHCCSGPDAPDHQLPPVPHQG
jgi:UDP-N-acetylglucosamine--dolichyl-phosphate N-acetylglucosaminephosphotransferase